MSSAAVNNRVPTTWAFQGPQKAGPIVVPAWENDRQARGEAPRMVQLNPDSDGDAREHLGRFARPIDLSCINPDDVFLPEYSMTAFKGVERRITEQSKLLSRFAFSTRGATRPGISVLFQDQGGCGSQMAVQVLAKRLNRRLFSLNLDAILGDSTAQTVKNLNATIDLAAACGAILEIDGVEALVHDPSNRFTAPETQITAAALERKLRTHCGVVVFTGTSSSAFKGGLRSVMTEIVEFPYPDLPQREAMWRRVFPAEVPTEDLPFEKIAVANLDFARIHNAAMRAASAASAEDRAVTATDVRESVQRELASSGRTTSGAELNY